MEFIALTAYEALGQWHYSLRIGDHGSMRAVWESLGQGTATAPAGLPSSADPDVVTAVLHQVIADLSDARQPRGVSWGDA